MTIQPFVTETQPFRVDDDLIRMALKNFVVDRDERNGETFGQFLIREAAFGSPFALSTYCSRTPLGPAAPRARLATRLHDFTTNRHESYGLVALRRVAQQEDCSSLLGRTAHEIFHAMPWPSKAPQWSVTRQHTGKGE